MALSAKSFLMLNVIPISSTVDQLVNFISVILTMIAVIPSMYVYVYFLHKHAHTQTKKKTCAYLFSHTDYVCYLSFSQWILLSLKKIKWKIADILLWLMLLFLPIPHYSLSLKENYNYILRVVMYYLFFEDIPIW